MNAKRAVILRMAINVFITRYLISKHRTLSKMAPYDKCPIFLKGICCFSDFNGDGDHPDHGHDHGLSLPAGRL